MEFLVNLIGPLSVCCRFDRSAFYFALGLIVRFWFAFGSLLVSLLLCEKKKEFIQATTMREESDFSSFPMIIMMFAMVCKRIYSCFHAIPFRSSVCEIFSSVC